MNRSECAEIRARKDAATPGPWARGCWGDPNGVGNLDNGCLAFCGDGDRADADAEFIACSRTDVERLLEAVERAMAVLDRTLYNLEKGTGWQFPAGDVAETIAEVRALLSEWEALNE